MALLADYDIIQELDNDYSAVVSPLIEDLRVLQDTGVEVTVDGKARLVKGKLVTTSADNLSAHDIAGFQRNFNSGRICRTCFAERNVIANNFIEDDYQLRTPSMHSCHIEALSSNPKKASVYGVKKECFC